MSNPLLDRPMEVGDMTLKETRTALQDTLHRFREVTPKPGLLPETKTQAEEVPSDERLHDLMTRITPEGTSDEVLAAYRTLYDEALAKTQTRPRRDEILAFLTERAASLEALLAKGK